MDPKRQIKAAAHSHLPGVAEVQLELELFNALNDFCDFTGAWQETISFNTQPSVANYLLTPVQGGMIIRLLAVLDPASIPQITKLGTLTPPSATVTYMNTPSITQVMTAMVNKSVIPGLSLDDNQVPIEFYQRWYQTLVDGVVAKCAMHPAKSYSNDDLGMFHGKLFQKGLNEARTDVLRQNTYGTNAWVFPQQFRTRTQRGGVSIGNNFGFGG